jgi:two-component system phosphate regulon response regulator PhoB
MPKEKILIVEDEKNILQLLGYNLSREGYGVIKCDNGEDAIDHMKDDAPDLMILDLMLPEMDGLEVCKVVKSDDKTKHIPIIMLTAKSEETDVVVGLQMGADDYITKPFSPKVLIARVKTVLRRKIEKQKAGDVRKTQGLVIDILRHKILYKDHLLDLTAIEFSILEFLSRHPGRAFNRDQIMDGAWKEGKFVVDRAVDVHIQSIRKKLGKGADLIETVRGIGYRFKEAEES